MSTPSLHDLLRQYWPLIQAELRRIGVSEEDERWIHAGSGAPQNLPPDQVLVRQLEALRLLPPGLGVEGYCAYLGFDYATVKAAIFDVDPNAT
jgi:hypothetical protein